MMTTMNRIRRIPLLLLPKKNASSVLYNRTRSVTNATAAATTTTVAVSAEVSHLMSHRSASSYALNYYSTSSSSSLIRNHRNTAQTGNNDDRLNHNLQPFQLHSQHQQRREFGTNAKKTYETNSNSNSKSSRRQRPAGVRLSALLSKHLGLSRRQSERMILTERVTLFGKIVNSPAFELHPSDDPNQNSKTAMKVDGKLISNVEDTLKVVYAELQQQQQNEVFAGDGGDGNDNGGKRSDRENYSNTRIWLANKLKGELITEDDPVGRPSMLQRLTRGGVGKPKRIKTSNNNARTQTQQQPLHLKPIGRLDMMTEGLMIFTNDGQYARQLELPTNKLWRTYRVRVHGRLTEGKLRAMRKGLTVRVNENNNMFGGGGGNGKGKHNGGGEDRKASGEVVNTGRLMKYKGIKVAIERKNLSQGRGGRGGGGGGTNTWLRITCTEGKNRQLRRILDALGLDVTRLIRISYGDYDLNTIPPGMAVEVPCKGLEGMSKKGRLFARSSSSSKKKEVKDEDGEETSAVQWVTYS